MKLTALPARLYTCLRLLCLLMILCGLSSCTFPGLVSTSAQLPQVSKTPQNATLPPIRFPQDEGAHNDLTEWWYYTGHLEATDATGTAHQYGFEFVVFQVERSTLSPVYASHFAISDITRHQFQYDQRRITSTAPAQSSSSGIHVQVGDWSIAGLNGQDHLAADMQNYAITLDLASTKAPVLHNGNGLITYGLAGFSYYYSRTHMNVSGTLQDHGQALHVTGLAWMDHQWGNFLTLGGGGWDWYSLQLRNNTEMMLYFIRDATGAVISTYVGYIDPSGQDQIIPASALHATVLDHWISPTTGINYPSGWRLEINDPHLSGSFTVTPLLQNQELVVTNSTGNIYWEGAVAIQGQVGNQPVNGQGYVELTGYTGSSHQQT